MTIRVRKETLEELVDYKLRFLRKEINKILTKWQLLKERAETYQMKQDWNSNG